MDWLISIIISGIKSSILIGIIYGIGSVGLSLIYRHLRFPDFTTVMAIVVSGIATVAYTNKYGIFVGIFAGSVVGGLLGSVTFTQITYAKIPPILAGIITSVSAISLAYLISSQQPVINFLPELRNKLDYFVNNIFSLQSLITLTITSLFICYGISQLFASKYGLYVLALSGSENYLANRHGRKNLATFLLLVGGNILIGFSGSLAAIQNDSVGVESHRDFLIIALGAYASGNFLMHLLAQPNVNQYLDKDNKFTALRFAFIYYFSKKAQLNDEIPTKIFYTLILCIFCATVINILFKTIEIELGGENHINWVVKAGIFFLILFSTNVLDKILQEKRK